MIIAGLQDSPNKVGIMTSKSTGEPPLLASVSVLTAFSAAVTAAKQGLAAMQAKAGNPQASVTSTKAATAGQATADSNGVSANGDQAAENGEGGAKQSHGTAADGESIQEQVLRQLQAPVTVKEVKRVLGQLQLSDLLLAREE